MNMIIFGPNAALLLQSMKNLQTPGAEPGWGAGLVSGSSQSGLISHFYSLHSDSTSSRILGTTRATKQQPRSLSPSAAAALCLRPSNRDKNKPPSPYHVPAPPSCRHQVNVAVKG